MHQKLKKSHKGKLRKTQRQENLNNQPDIICVLRLPFVYCMIKILLKRSLLQATNDFYFYLLFNMSIAHESFATSLQKSKLQYADTSAVVW